MNPQKLFNVVSSLVIVGFLVFVVGFVKFVPANDNEPVNAPEWEKHGKYVSTKVIKIKGHDYIIATLLGESVSVIHAEHCFCKR